MERPNAARTPWVIVLLVIIAACGVSILAGLLIKGSGVDSFGTLRTVATANGASVDVFDDGFVYYDGSTLTCISSMGQTRWSYLIGAGAEFTAEAGGVSAWIGNKLTLIDISTGVATYSGVQEADISSAVSGTRYAAALLEPEPGGNIVVMEKGGKTVYEADLSSVSVVDYGFFSSGSLLWVMAVDTTGSVPTCEISTYKPSSKMVMGSISDTEQLMYSVAFKQSEICCSGVTYYKVFDYTCTEITGRRKLVYGWYLISADDSNDPLMAFVPTGETEAGSELKDVRLITSASDQIVRMPFACKTIIAKGDSAYGFSADGHVMVAKLGRQSVDAYTIGVPVDDVYGITDDGAAVISSNGMVYILSLREE